MAVNRARLGGNWKRVLGAPLALAMLSVAPMTQAATEPAQASAPPVPEIGVENWYWGPGNQWSYQHTRRVFPSADVYRGDGPVAKLDYAPQEIDNISFIDPTTHAPMTIAQMYEATDTDALLVMKDGKIVAERYFHGMTATDTHLLMSVTKSVVGALTGIVVAEGRLDLNAPITQYVPEVKGSAYDGATVRQLIDMTVGLGFNEDYASKTSDLYRLDEAAGWVPQGPNAPRGLHDYFPSLKTRLGPHGQVFRYVSANVDLMGWVLERATHTDFAALASQELWSKLGAERDAYVLLDRRQAAYSDAGFNATLRDLGRFSQMMLQNGAYNRRQIVPEAWVRDIHKGGDAQAWKLGGFYSEMKDRYGYADGSYRSYWYVADPTVGLISAIGLAGQLIVIDPKSNMVVVKFSSEKTPETREPDIEYAGAIAIIKALSATGGAAGR